MDGHNDNNELLQVAIGALTALSAAAHGVSGQNEQSKVSTGPQDEALAPVNPEQQSSKDEDESSTCEPQPEAAPSSNAVQIVVSSEAALPVPTSAEDEAVKTMLQLSSDNETSQRIAELTQLSNFRTDIYFEVGGRSAVIILGDENIDEALAATMYLSQGSRVNSRQYVRAGLEENKLGTEALVIPAPYPPTQTTDVSILEGQKNPAPSYENSPRIETMNATSVVGANQVNQASLAVLPQDPIQGSPVQPQVAQYMQQTMGQPHLPGLGTELNRMPMLQQQQHVLPQQQQHKALPQQQHVLPQQLLQQHQHQQSVLPQQQHVLPQQSLQQHQQQQAVRQQQQHVLPQQPLQQHQQQQSVLSQQQAGRQQQHQQQQSVLPQQQAVMQHQQQHQHQHQQRVLPQQQAGRQHQHVVPPQPQQQQHQQQQSVLPQQSQQQHQQQQSQQNQLLIATQQLQQQHQQHVHKSLNPQGQQRHPQLEQQHQQMQQQMQHLQQQNQMAGVQQEQQQQLAQMSKRYASDEIGVGPNKVARVGMSNLLETEQQLRLRRLGNRLRVIPSAVVEQLLAQKNQKMQHGQQSGQQDQLPGQQQQQAPNLSQDQLRALQTQLELKHPQNQLRARQLQRVQAQLQQQKLSQSQLLRAQSKQALRAAAATDAVPADSSDQSKISGFTKVPAAPKEHEFPTAFVRTSGQNRPSGTTAAVKSEQENVLGHKSVVDPPKPEQPAPPAKFQHRRIHNGKNDGVVVSPKYKVTNEEVRPADVLLGRTKTALAHPGNAQFRKHVRLNRETYQKAQTRSVKRRTVNGIMDAISKLGGRFLNDGVDDLGNECYAVVSPEKAYEKVSHALRSAKVTKGGLHPPMDSAMEKEPWYAAIEKYNVNDPR